MKYIKLVFTIFICFILCGCFLDDPKYITFETKPTTFLFMFYINIIFKFRISFANRLFFQFSYTVQHILWYFCWQMLFRVVEHGSADAVFAISAVQHIDIDATLASTPESLVVCKISEGDRLISQLSIHGHYGRSAGERENFGMWPSSSCQSERHVLDFLSNAKMTIVWMYMGPKVLSLFSFI